MKTAQLPPVRVTPAVRQDIENVLRGRETLSQFVEQAAVEAAQRRKVQMEFVARGRVSLARSRNAGEYYAATDVPATVQHRLEARVTALRQCKAAGARRP